MVSLINYFFRLFDECALVFQSARPYDHPVDTMRQKWQDQRLRCIRQRLRQQLPAIEINYFHLHGCYRRIAHLNIDTCSNSNSGIHFNYKTVCGRASGNRVQHNGIGIQHTAIFGYLFDAVADIVIAGIGRCIYILVISGSG